MTVRRRVNQARTRGRLECGTQVVPGFEQESPTTDRAESMQALSNPPDSFLRLVETCRRRTC